MQESFARALRTAWRGGVISPPAGPSPFSYNGRQDTGGPDYGARLNQLFGSFGIFTFQYAQHKDRYNTKPLVIDVPTVGIYTTSVDPVTGRLAVRAIKASVSRSSH